MKGNLNKRPEGPGLGEQELRVWSSFWSRYGILRSCLAGQMCRISVVDQIRGAMMRKQGPPWGTLQKWCSDCLPNILRGGGVQTTTEERGSQSKRAFKGLS